MISSVEEAIRTYEWFAGHPAPPKPAAEPLEESRAADTSRISLVRDEIGQYISAHFSEDMSMQDVARAMNYSEA